MNLKLKYFLPFFIGILLLSMSSCNTFLDKMPDDRTELDSKEKISALLISAYSYYNYSVIAELSSDNLVDNNAVNPSLNLSSFTKMYDEIFAWEPAVYSVNQDSPNALWSSSYFAISVANNALEAIEKLEKAGSAENFDAERGEALISRAYHHFVLANIFCHTYKNETASMQDVGIPYVDQAVNTVNPTFPRGTVTEVYQKIEADIESGFKLIDEKYYGIAKYRFNKKAAAAFAARFYLYKRNYEQVVNYANIALGDSFTRSSMRDWFTVPPAILSMLYNYIDAAKPFNFLLMTSYSHLEFSVSGRYGHNDDALKGTLNGALPMIKEPKESSIRKFLVSRNQEYGVYLPKCVRIFEYADRVTGNGYSRNVKAEFTAEETLLCRAEAYVYQNKSAEAFEDLKLWHNARTDSVLTLKEIKNFYSESNPTFVKKYNTEKISPEFIISNEQKPLIDCVLHFRRIETIFDGLRWFDIKRYGIEIEHKIGPEKRIDKLAWNDPRRALQIPASVISAGLKPNVYTEEKIDRVLVNFDDEENEN